MARLLGLVMAEREESERECDWGGQVSPLSQAKVLVLWGTIRLWQNSNNLVREHGNEVSSPRIISKLIKEADKLSRQQKSWISWIQSLWWAYPYRLSRRKWSGGDFKNINYVWGFRFQAVTGLHPMYRLGRGQSRNWRQSTTLCVDLYMYITGISLDPSW